MRVHWLILIFALLAGNSAAAQKIERFSRVDIPSAQRDEQFGQNEVFAEWLNDSEIVAFTRDRRLSRIEVATRKRKWSRRWLYGVADFAVCSSCQRVGLICPKTSDDIDELINPSVVLIDAKDGSTFLTTDTEQLAKKTNGEFSSPYRIAIHPKNHNVLIVKFSTHFGSNAFVFSPRLDEIQKRIGVDAMPKEIAFSKNGDRVTILADFDVLNIRNVNKNTDVYFAGKRYEKPRDWITSVTDAPFYSNAFHDGGNLLVYSRDNSWATGRVFVHRLNEKSTIDFNGMNGHIVMDVDFTNERIAVSGTSQDICLFDFDGKKLAELSNPTGRRNHSIRFSPNGEKLLICNWDAIWAFNIKPK